jgi:cell division septation protein DedD
MTKGPTISSIVWIVAIVLLVTFLIVVVAWMSSGKLKVESADKTPVENSVAEKRVEPNSFVPETGANTSGNTAVKEPPPPVQKSDIEPPPPPVVVEEKITPKTQDTPKKEEAPPEKTTEAQPAEQSKSFALQLGAFSSAENAKAFEKRLAGRGFKTTLKEKGSLTAVLIVGIKTNEEALKLKEKLEKENIKSSLITLP